MSLATTFQIMRMFATMVGRVPTGHLWYLLRRLRFEKPHRVDGQIRINTFFPPYPSRAFDRFCRALIDRRRVPYSTYLAATSACPFRCPHCSYTGRPAGQMSREQMLDIIGQIKSLGTCTLGLTGGEPLLRDDLEDIVAAAAPEMVCIVFTAGYGLDAQRARRLAAAGVSCVTIGLESADAATHDRIRGQAGSFAMAQSAVEECLESGVYTAVSTVGMRERVAAGELESIYELARRWGVGEFRVLAPVATGAWVRCGSQMLTPQESRALRDFHISHNRRREGPTVVCNAYLESDELFGCGAGFHHLFIDATGQVCPCDLTPLSFGDVTVEPLAEIWERMGTFFPLPRCGCLMGKVTRELSAAAAADVAAEFTRLPLPREKSEPLCPRRSVTDPLPEGYKRLLKGPSTLTCRER
ncbi:MAG TPA: radical SAM protein [Phycisphaerae bacterium]|nr:radical SAM protein [Phycisphaerae bacterium]